MGERAQGTKKEIPLKPLTCFLAVPIFFSAMLLFSAPPVEPSVVIQNLAASAILCTYTGQEQAGGNKICYYSCAGSAAAITVKSYEVCPVTIDQ